MRAISFTSLLLMPYEVVEQSLVELTAPQPSVEVSAALSSQSPPLGLYHGRPSTMLFATRLAVFAPVGLCLIPVYALAALITARVFENGAEVGTTVRWFLLCWAWVKGEITTSELFR